MPAREGGDSFWVQFNESVCMDGLCGLPGFLSFLKVVPSALLFQRPSNEEIRFLLARIFVHPHTVRKMHIAACLLSAGVVCGKMNLWKFMK